MTSTKLNEFNKSRSSLMKSIKLCRDAYCCFENFVTYYFDAFALLSTILLTMLLLLLTLLNILLKKIR